ncbi:MAG: VWA domain-containing protein [Armatimonadetes bacterium]|nr:VWA domain-containing protein [Armatimonadota bacterium]
MHFAHPHYLWFLVLVAGLGFFLASREQARRKRLSMFASSRMLGTLAADYSPTRVAMKNALLLAAFASLVIALAGPQWGARLTRVERNGVDVVVAVDCSASMNAEDTRPSRMQVARREVGDLVEKLQGNRLGLVGFAGSAFVFCPLTLDLSAAHMFVEQMDSNVIPVPGTAIGEAIRAALSAYPKESKGAKVMVLISDGEDHRSDPIGAAKEAAARGVVIHTVGLGKPDGEQIPEKDASGNVIGYVRDASGNPVASKLDEKTLQEIAKIAGGIYTHSETGVDMLGPVVEAINNAEKTRLESQLRRRYEDRFQIFIGLAVLLLIAERMVGTRRAPLRLSWPRRAEKRTEVAA